MRRPPLSMLVAPLAPLLIMTGFAGMPAAHATPAHWVEQEDKRGHRGGRPPML